MVGGGEKGTVKLGHLREKSGEAKETPSEKFKRPTGRGEKKTKVNFQLGPRYGGLAKRGEFYKEWLNGGSGNEANPRDGGVTLVLFVQHGENKVRTFRGKRT